MQISSGAPNKAPSTINDLPVELSEATHAAATSSSSPGRLRGFLNSYLESNPYFSAGFGLMAVGITAQLVRKSVVHLSTLAQRRLLVSLEISSRDASYHWFLQWMGANSARQVLPASTAAAAAASTPPPTLTENMTLWTKLARGLKSHELAVETKYEERKDGSSSAQFALVPGPGTHYFVFQGAWIQVRRERATNMLDLNSGTPWETVTLTTLSRDRYLFPLLLAEARQLAQAAQEGKTVVYTAWGAEWRPFGRPRIRRVLESVVLDRDVKERVVEDLQSFMKRGPWYFQRGIPYRRGYLLYGPPGSGKSSFIQALAGSLEYNICVLNLSERGLTDDKLTHLLANAPERTIILLEDVDAAFSARREGNEGFVGSVTFSGLLNALDGVASSSSQRILFMTTNHIERLDPALIRPGRVDLQELIDDATPYQAAQLFIRFYGGDDGLPAHDLGRLGDQLVEKLKRVASEGKKISMASLQGHFIRHSGPEAVQKFDDLVREQSEHRRGKERVMAASSASI